jgi:hypothetical protein
MRRGILKKLMTLTALLIGSVVTAQSVEYYVGHQRMGVDLMWYKYFKNAESKSTPFLFFSRNRANVDYEQSPTAFGSTNAVSYNFKNGIGVVSVASFVNTGFVPKAGVQYVKIKGSFLFFGWLVADLKQEGNVDLFGLFRLTPEIHEHWKAFIQAELFPVYTPSSMNWSLTERFRLGAKYHAWAAGLMMDFNQSGTNEFVTTNNIGGFVRYDF